MFGFFTFVLFLLFFFERSERVKSPHPMAIWIPLCFSLALPVSTFLLSPLSSLLPQHLHPLCVFELCIQAAATFQCVNCHWLLHPGQANQVPPLTPSSTRVPPTAYFCMRIWCLEYFLALGAGSSPYHSQCGVMRRERRIIRNWFCGITFMFSFLFCFVWVCLCKTCSCWNQLCL